MERIPVDGQPQESDQEARPASPLALTPFSIQRRKVAGYDSQEEGDEILAEYDYLLHHAKRISASLGGKQVVRMVLKEDQGLLVFQVVNKEEAQGYQSSKPYPWVEALALFQDTP